jgi:hypothetical protein
MATQKQIEANRANAQTNTGPSTPESKEAVSQNATKHGLTGRFIIYNEEDKELYVRTLQQLQVDLQPFDFHESELVDLMAQSLWRSQKAIQLQDECIDQLAFENDPEYIAPLQKKLELYMRYQTNHDRAYQRYAAELRKFQEARRKSEIGIVSQRQKTEQHEAKIALANARLEHQNLRNRQLTHQLNDVIPPAKPVTPVQHGPEAQRLAA